MAAGVRVSTSSFWILQGNRWHSETSSPRKVLTQGWAWRRLVSVLQNKMSNYDTDLSSPYLKPSRRYRCYCRLKWRFPGWLLVLSKIKQLCMLLLCEGTCDHLPALLLITQCSESGGLVRALHSCPCRLSWDYRIWLDAHALFLITPALSPLEPSRVKTAPRGPLPSELPPGFYLQGTGARPYTGKVGAEDAGRD